MIAASRKKIKLRVDAGLSRRGGGGIIRPMIRTDDPPPHIRPFEPADLPRLQEIRRAAFAPVFQSFRDIVGPAIAEAAFAGADEAQADLLSAICAGDEYEAYVAEWAGEVVGFVCIKLDQRRRLGEIGLNAVRPDFAGRGVGAGMHRFALARMKATGMIAAEVGTGGDASHAAARRAYEKAGFGHAIPSLTLYKRL
jgi:GNAT superfamily N-acetyltransferase